MNPLTPSTSQKPLDFDVFVPRVSPMVAPAYGLVYRLLLLGCLIALVGWALNLLIGSTAQPVDKGMMGWLVAGLALVLYMGVVMLRSRTTLTTDTLSQDWVWEKKVILSQVTYVRLIRLRGMEWLIAPRLLVRDGHGPFKAFHTSSPDMWKEFERWSHILAKISQK